MLIGRDEERRLIGDLLDAARASRSGVLVVHGDPGVGKTALLRDTRDRADDMRVLVASGVQSETELAFAGLDQLLRPELSLLERLPGPQSEALRGALGLARAGADDRFLISAACLTLLSELAERRPVLCLVDDVQWLDRPSVDALLFVARRLGAEGIVTLFGVRDGDGFFDDRGLPSLRLGTLTRSDAASLVVHSADVAVSPSVLDRIVEQSGGNALALVQLPGALTADQLTGTEELPETLPLPRDLTELFLARFHLLSEETQQALLVVAVDDTRSLATIGQALAVCGNPGIASIDEAERAGLITIRGTRIDFTHPLIRAAVYDSAASSDRRRAHRALADALTDHDQQHRRAWHLAAASTGPNAEVAAALEDAAEVAIDRAGFAAGAAAFERAAELTADESDRLQRRFRAAQAYWQAGHGDRALALLERTLPDTHEPLIRADMLHLVGHILRLAGPPLAAHDRLVEAAASVGDLDPFRATEILSDAFEAALYAGEPGTALAAARRAHELAPSDGGVAHGLAQLNLAEALFVSGDTDTGLPMFQTGLEEVEPHLASQPDPYLSTRAAIATCWLERAADAWRLSTDAVKVARNRGSVAALPYALFVAARAARRVGRWDEALTSAGEGAKLARDLGQDTMVLECLYELAIVAAGRGREDELDACLDDGARIAERIGGRYLAEAMETQRGVLELTLGRLESARQALDASAARLRKLDIRVSEFVPIPDLVEVHVRLGDPAEAAHALARATDHQAHPRTAGALVARCRGLLAEDDDFVHEFTAALSAHPIDEDVFGRARTQLCFGERLRRSRRRVEAREQLRTALQTFERLGAKPWAERARSELRASGESASRQEATAGMDTLTVQELQVAGFVAKGYTNKEVAAQLFLSPRTIDAHMRSVFAKLGLTSRTQLRGMSLGSDAVAAAAES